MDDERREAENRFDLNQELGQLLDGPQFRWDSFATFTFKRAPRGCPLGEYTHIRRYVEQQQARGSTAHHAVFAERGSRFGRWHLHALVEHPGLVGSDLKREWERRYGFAGIKKYDYNYGAGHYLANYACKSLDNLADWAILTTHGSGAVDGLFEPAARMTGYQLYSRWVQATAGSKRKGA